MPGWSNLRRIGGHLHDIATDRCSHTTEEDESYEEARVHEPARRSRTNKAEDDQTRHHEALELNEEVEFPSPVVSKECLGI